MTDWVRCSWVPQRGGLDPARLPPILTVAAARGGESLQARRGRTHSHACSICVKAMGVLPWMRDALPLVYAGEALIAVGDLWLDARWCVAAMRRDSAADGRVRL